MTHLRCVLKVETEGLSKGLHRKELNLLPRARGQLCSDRSQPQNNKLRNMLIQCGLRNKQKTTKQKVRLKSHCNTMINSGLSPQKINLCAYKISRHSWIPEDLSWTPTSTPNRHMTRRVICLWIQVLKMYELEIYTDSLYYRNLKLEEWTMDNLSKVGLYIIYF